MKKNYLYLVAIAMLTAACSNENDPIQNGGKPATEVNMITETITASNGDNSSATRADIDDTSAAFTWSTDDKIAIHVDDKYYPTEALTSEDLTDGNAEASFTVSYPEGGVRNAFAVFPASIVATDATNYGQSGAALDVTLPGSYTLVQVSGTTTPCPMIATNAPGGTLDFKQLCGLLRLTVNDIPDDAVYLQLDFDGNQVCGDFSIASPDPGTSTITTSAITGTSASNASDKIKITELGGATSAVINIPLPAGQYSSITVSAVTSSNVKVGELSFSYEANRAKGKKGSIDIPSTTITFKQGTVITPSSSNAVELESIIGFEFKDGETTLDNLRFVRIFSEDNLLQATYKEGTNESTNGPITEARNNDDDDNLPQTVYLGMRFNETAQSPIVVQVIDADGKVYSGITTVPVSFKNGYYYKKIVSVPVKLYKFTVSTNKKVCFSPGDLGVDNGVYSFTEPFTTWGWEGNNSTTKRVWFNYPEVNYTDIDNGLPIYGVNWRIETWYNNSLSTENKYEWNYLIGRTIDGGNVASYYHVKIGSTNCLLLPPDEAVASDVEGLTSGSTITDYVKYLGKGFVLLMNTGRATATSGLSWDSSQEGWYWLVRQNNTSNRFYFTWTSTGTPKVAWFANQARMRVRLIHDVN